MRNTVYAFFSKFYYYCWLNKLQIINILGEKNDIFNISVKRVAHDIYEKLISILGIILLVFN